MNLEPSLKIRSVAATLIGDALRKKQSFELAFSRNQDVLAMDNRDRAFVHNLTLTTLRRLGQIDQLIDSCLKHPLPRSAQRVQDLLRIGVCQVLFLNVANHGAVSTCVELARQEGYASHVKLVNAVLRRLVRKGELSQSLDNICLNTPAWLWKTWLEAYGREECHKIAAAHLNECYLDLSSTGNPSALAKLLSGKLLPSGTVRISTRGKISDLAGFREGKWWVQDIAARLVASLAGDVAGKSVIDLCAAPGGKTAFFAASGGVITAVDRSATRLCRLHKNLRRLNLQATVVEDDAVSWRPTELADVVMLDAPCSSTGTARRHPDVLWSKSEKDIINLVKIQRKMLYAAAEMVAPNGLLIFATCSLQPAEGRHHITPFLADHKNFSLVPVTKRDMPKVNEVITNPGIFRSLPCHFSKHGGMDGFFAARFQRQ